MLKPRPIDCVGLTGESLREARERAGVSLRELAEEWDLNVGTLSNLETGKKISRPLVERYMDRFGVAGQMGLREVPRGTYLYEETA